MRNQKKETSGLGSPPLKPLPSVLHGVILLYSPTQSIPHQNVGYPLNQILLCITVQLFEMAKFQRTA